jgi:hypothetical protein
MPCEPSHLDSENQEAHGKNTQPWGLICQNTQVLKSKFHTSLSYSTHMKMQG